MEQEYQVQLQLTRLSDNQIEESLPGSGTSPYEAMREASKKALEFFTSFGSETLKKTMADIATNGETHDTKNGDQKDSDAADKIDAVDLLQNGQASDIDINDGDDSGSSGEEDSPGDNESNDESDEDMNDVDSKHDWIGSLENFYAKALADKLGNSVSIKFHKHEETGVTGEDICGYTVRCEIGKLSVVKTEDTFTQAKQMAAKSMLDRIETHLESRNDIIRMIVDTKGPFQDETIVTDDEDVSVDKDDDDQYVATLDSSDEDEAPRLAASALDSAPAGPATKTSEVEAAAGEMMPGVEYAMALMRTDKPTGIYVYE